MNNPHNMWTDKNQNLIYQTQWFDSKLTVFNRTTGQLVDNITVGESPAHVMTQVGSDKLNVTLNGSTDHKSVVELSANAGGILRKIDIGEGNPHAHWMSHNGELMVTPNPFDNNSTEYNFTNDTKALLPTGALPIATGMTPDSTKAYVANLLDSTITVINTQTKNVVGTIDLLKIGVNYDPITGAVTGPVGALPIQTPVSPDGTNMVTANTQTGTITIVNPVTDTVVAMLPCDPGCHGVQYGAKQGGGYYAYVSSKFSTVCCGPAPGGNPANAALRTHSADLRRHHPTDDAIRQQGHGRPRDSDDPVVYNGWVRTCSGGKTVDSPQRNPIQ